MPSSYNVEEKIINLEFVVNCAKLVFVNTQKSVE